MLRTAAEGLAADAVQAMRPLESSPIAAIASPAPTSTAWLGSGKAAIVRAMPNRAALVGAGAAGLQHATPKVSAMTQQTRWLKTTMEAVGLALWIRDNPLSWTRSRRCLGSGPRPDCFTY